MWISKKKYNALVAQKEDFDRIASNAVAQNGRLLDEWSTVLQEMKDIQRFNHVLVDRNEELAAMVDEMRSALDTARRQVEELEHQLTETEIDLWDAQATAEAYKIEKEDMESNYIAEKNECGRLRAKLEFAIQQRDYYYDLLENTSEVEEKDE